MTASRPPVPSVAVLFRYVSPQEHTSIKFTERILSASGETYLTPAIYENVAEATNRLALPTPPRFRVGPIAGQFVVEDGIPLQRVPSAFGRPGGGWQLSTRQPIPYGATAELV